ncbi:hypothetical protein ACR77J_07710 [Tissierella praeacuta]|uniref:hypothetical protein n=1 Tax=Tissierella praeacuta TaxID=43131 RepID=UPI003DA5EAE8
MKELKFILKELYKELDNYIVKDTYTKGKNAGLRRAIIIVKDRIAAIENNK